MSFFLTAQLFREKEFDWINQSLQEYDDGILEFEPNLRETLTQDVSQISEHLAQSADQYPCGIFIHNTADVRPFQILSFLRDKLQRFPIYFPIHVRFSPG